MEHDPIRPLFVILVIVWQHDYNFSLWFGHLDSELDTLVWFGLHPWDLEILQTWAQKFVSPLIMLSHNQQNQWKVTCMVHLKSIKVYTPFPQLQFQFLSLIRFYLFQTLLHQLQSSHAFLDFRRANVIIELTLLTATNVPTSLTAKEVLDELIPSLAGKLILVNKKGFKSFS